MLSSEIRVPLEYMVFRNLPEVRSAHEILGVPSVSARFGTAPFFWNWGMEAMTKLFPAVSHLDIACLQIRQLLSVCMNTKSQCNIDSDRLLNLLWNGYCYLLYIKYFPYPYDYELHDIVESDLMMQTSRIAKSGTSFVGLISLFSFERYT